MPSFDLESFKSNFSGGARSYLFYFLPLFPGIIAGGITQEKASYLVRTTSLPETTFEEIITPWQGFDFKFAGKHTYSPLEVEFNVDRNADIRTAYEDWINLIHDPETNQWAPLEEYMVNQAILLLDYDGQPVMDYKLIYAWPSTVGPVTLDYAGTETAMFSVTFTYAYHTVNKITSNF